MSDFLDAVTLIARLDLVVSVYPAIECLCGFARGTNVGNCIIAVPLTFIATPFD